MNKKNIIIFITLFIVIVIIIVIFFIVYKQNNKTNLSSTSTSLSLVPTSASLSLVPTSASLAPAYLSLAPASLSLAPTISTTTSLTTSTLSTPSLSSTPSLAPIFIKENVYLLDSTTNKYCTVDNNNYLICNVDNKNNAKLFEISTNDAASNKYYIKTDGNNDAKIKYNMHSSLDMYVSIYKKDEPNNIYISKHMKFPDIGYNMYCSIGSDNYLDCGYKKMDIKPLKIESENNNLFNSLEYLPDYTSKGCYNDFPMDKELSTFVMRGTITDCDRYAKNNNYKLYGLQNYNESDKKVDCMVSTNKDLDTYGKYGTTNDITDSRTIVYGNANSNCIYGTDNTSKIETDNIMCYDKNNNIIIVPKSEKFEKCKISCMKKDDNIYNRDINNYMTSYNSTSYKKIINDKMLDDNNFITGIYNDIKSECKRFIDVYTQEVKCYNNNDISKGDDRLIDMDKDKLSYSIYLCAGFTMKCKDYDNNDIIVDSVNIKNDIKKCAQIYNNKTNEYIYLDKIKNDKSLERNLDEFIIPKDSKLTIKKNVWSASPSNENENISTIDLNNNDTTGNLIICKNPMKKLIDIDNNAYVGNVSSDNKLVSSFFNSCDL